MSRMMPSTYSWLSFVGLVSSKRRWQRPPNSLAMPKSMAMALAWPMCRWPLGSGGNRVITLPPKRPVRLCSRMMSRMKVLGLVSSVIQPIVSSVRLLSCRRLFGGKEATMAYARLVSLLLLLVLAVPALALAGADGRNDRAVTVMTRNLYFGADLTPAITARTVPELIGAVSHIFGVVQASNIPARAEAIAAEVAAVGPDLVGVQEVVLWRSQCPSDFAPVPNAVFVEFDYLQSLLDALTARGAAYEVVAVHETNDLEAPGFTTRGFCDVRFTDREVILARVDRA